ncbi:MAG: DNA polymerase IV, partial [Erysipelotrichales bacterium]|nr:DNA polymerase IV [Erysipelotrichales bacterium]
MPEKYTENKERVILHCDCNAFFASAESIDHPEYRTVPMIVAGDPKARHGIVLAKNELAKKYGIVTAETIGSAKRKCPDLLVVAPHYELYSKISRKINAIYL